MFGIALRQNLCPTPNGCAQLNRLPALASAAIAHATRFMRIQHKNGKDLIARTTPSTRNHAPRWEGSPVLEAQLYQPPPFPPNQTEGYAQIPRTPLLPRTPSKKALSIRPPLMATKICWVVCGWQSIKPHLPLKAPQSGQPHTNSS